MRLPTLCLIPALLALAACSPSPEPAASAPIPVPVPAQPAVTAQEAGPAATAAPDAAATISRDRLLAHIWELTSPEGRPPRSIYVFLPDGSLLMGSCVETYRIASWKLDGRQIEIIEDAQTRYMATIAELGDSTLRLKLNLISEEIELGFRPAEAQTVCPDLRR